MGNEATVVGKPLEVGQASESLLFRDAPEVLAARHGLPSRVELEELLYHLHGLSCRDQEVNAFDPQKMKERRREGYALAKSMRKEAQAMLQSLARLHRYYQAFQEKVQFNPALLETIFDVDTAGPENLFLPPELGILQTLFESEMDRVVREFIDSDPELTADSDPSLAAACPPGFWETVDERLQAVVNLPIAPRLPSGPVPNMVVRSALFACRAYWLGLGQSWTMSALKTPEVRNENLVHTLQGKCERFVADALSVSGICFNLSELHSSWEYVDAEARRPISST